MTSTGRLPTFLLIGAMKSGTTSLHAYLRSHPQVFMAPTKEVDFFVEELNWGRGLAWYRRQFREAPAGAAVGEASTSYTKYPRYAGVAERIASVLPDVRLVYVVRDPIERIRSHHRHNVTLGEEHRPLDVAVRDNPAYVDYSRYAMQLRRYTAAVQEERILVVTAEALRSDRAATVAEVLSFIGVAPGVDPQVLAQEHYRSDERGTYGPFAAAVRNTLRRAFPSRTSLWRGSFVPQGVKRVLASRSAGEPDDTISDETRAWIHDEVRGDVEDLRTTFGVDVGAWSTVA